MASFDYRLNYPIKECSTCGALYTTDYCCSDGSLGDKIICDLNKTPELFQEPSQNCPKCGNLVDGHYCQGYTSEPSNDNTKVVNALQEPFVVKQDPGENSSQSPPQIDHHCCYGCGDSLEDIFCHQCTCELCGKGAHYGYNCPQKVPIVPNPKPFNNQTIDELPQTTILEIELAFEDKHYQPEDILELFRGLHNDVQNIHKELAVYINTLNWDRPTICYNDDDDKDCTIAVTPILSIKEPDNSLSMGDEYLDTITTTKSDKFIKSSVENLVSIPSESEGIPDNMCDVPFHDNSPPLDVSKDQFEDFSYYNDDSTSIDEEISSGSTTTRSDISLPDYEVFYDDHVKETSSGSATTHSDFSLYDSFIFDLSINLFPPADMSDFIEFADELVHIISPLEYDCFCFKNEPNSRDFTMDVVEDIYSTKEPIVHDHNVLPTHPTL
uniref:Uncharacterized protein n=1 Tax=Tanacetum cinerariifolium TaxID=118510 RepID=A0A6L2LK48_TANCI|nr:hypothetical protein [Tanacetum cinerariifolium]